MKKRFPYLIGTVVLLVLAIFTAVTVHNSRQVEAENTPNSARLLSMVNAERQKAGLGVLETKRSLAQAAGDKCGDMVASHYYAHTSPDGKDQVGFINQRYTDWTVSGENLLRDTGFTTEQNDLSSWMNSTEHRKNILDTKWKYTGMSICKDTATSTYYFVEYFVDK